MLSGRLFGRLSVRPAVVRRLSSIACLLPIFIVREFKFYEFFLFLKFNEFYDFFSVEKNSQKKS